MEEYEPIRVLGEGAFGKVYLMRQRTQRTLMCVKVIKITREDGDDPAVTFSVEWALNPKVRLSLVQLQDLEAIGLAYRYRLLKQRGVSL